MALFSFKESPPGTFQLILESGVVPLNIMGLKNEALGIDFSAREMLRVMGQQHQRKHLSSQEKFVLDSWRARFDAMADGRIYIARGKNPEDVRDWLQEKFTELGHCVEGVKDAEPRAACYHLVQGETGPYLAVNGAYAMTAINQLAAHGFNVTGFLRVPGASWHRIEMDGAADPVALAGKLASNKRNNLINHTREKVPNLDTKVVFSRPFLVTGKQGVELHVSRGNTVELEGLLPDGSFVHGENGSFILKGTQADQKAVLKKLSERGMLGAKVPRNLPDVEEKTPTVAVASHALDITSNRLNQQVKVGDEAKQRVASFKLKESALEEQQVIGAAFILENSHSLNADATGGGKTLMSAVGLHLRTPPGKKVLVTCPPDIIAQWVRQVDRFIPDIDGPEPLEKNKTPDWFKRLPQKVQDELGPAWARVGRRFVFLPESALESGVTVSRAALKLADPDNEKARAKNALEEIRSLLQEPIASVLVDEAHEFRNAGEKFAVLETIASGRARALSGPIENVVLATATPLHRDAPDLFPILRLLGRKKFQKMSVEDFCENYCQRKVTLKEDGKRGYAVQNPPYGYGMLKESKIAEIAGILGEVMISREKHELAPRRVRAQKVTSPLPYEPSESLGVRLSGFEQAGPMIGLDSSVRHQLNLEGSYQARSIALANAKVAQTIRDTVAYMEANPGKKVVVFSEYVDVARRITAELKTAGYGTSCLTSRNRTLSDGSSVATKQQLVDDFVENPGNQILVATVGAGGTGIDGLHKVARFALVNDYSVVAGRQIQAEGRICRTEDRELPIDAEFAHVHYQVADHPLDHSKWRVLMERRHQMEFVRQQGLLQALDSHEVKAEKEMLLDEFADKLYDLIGEKPEAPKLRDNTFLAARAASEAADEAQLLMSFDLSPAEDNAPGVSVPTPDEARLQISSLAPPDVEDAPMRKPAPVTASPAKD